MCYNDYLVSSEECGNMALDLPQIITEYHTPSLQRLKIFSDNDRLFVLKDMCGPHPVSCHIGLDPSVIISK